MSGPEGDRARKDAQAPQESAAPPSAPDAGGSGAPAQARPKRRRRGRFLFWLLLVALVAGLVWAHRTGRLEVWIARWQAAHEAPAPAPKRPAAPPAAPEQAGHVPPEARVRLMALMQALDGLSARMQSLEEALSARREALEAERRTMFELGLARAAAPGGTLAEVAAGWRIAAAAAPAGPARQAARERAREAARLVREALEAHRALARAAEALRAPWEPHNLIPQPDNPWLARLVGWVRLYRAPPRDVARRAELAARLRAVAEGLLLGEAPAADRWEALRAEALLDLRALGRRDLRLPRALAPIAARARALREAARARLEGGAS